MMAIDALEKHGLTPGGREVVVTGATGGVGSIAVAVLANLGYNVVAATGRPEETDYLKQLGAQSIIERQAISAPSNRPMESERWAGAIDNVGGDVLAGLIRSMATRASIAVVGNAGGPAFSTTVFPFLLRGINLLGIGSADFPAEQRPALWHRLANELPMHLLDEMTKVVPLSEAQTVSQAIIKNQIRGRTVVDVNA
jgi:acrylyl-CoA reductase (NADPH)